MDLLTIILWGIAIVIFIILTIIFVFLYLTSYDYKVRIRELTGGKTRIIFDTTGKLKKDDDNVYVIKLLRKKGIHDFIPVPPSSVIDYDGKSRRKVVETYYSDESGYVFIKDQGNVTGFQPLTTDQRLAMVSQLKKKEARKKVPWTQYLPFIASGIVLVVVIAIVLIFWGQAVQPMIAIGQNYEALLEKTNQILDKAILLSGEGQVVSGTAPIPP
jgi:hypothetical protein